MAWTVEDIMNSIGHSAADMAAAVSPVGGGARKMALDSADKLGAVQRALAFNKQQTAQYNNARGNVQAQDQYHRDMGVQQSGLAGQPNDARVAMNNAFPMQAPQQQGSVGAYGGYQNMQDFNSAGGPMQMDVGAAAAGGSKSYAEQLRDQQMERADVEKRLEDLRHEQNKFKLQQGLYKLDMDKIDHQAEVNANDPYRKAETREKAAKASQEEALATPEATSAALKYKAAATDYMMAGVGTRITQGDKNEAQANKAVAETGVASHADIKEARRYGDSTAAIALKQKLEELKAQKPEKAGDIDALLQNLNIAHVTGTHTSFFDQNAGELLKIDPSLGPWIAQTRAVHTQNALTLGGKKANFDAFAQPMPGTPATAPNIIKPSPGELTPQKSAERSALSGSAFAIRD